MSELDQHNSGRESDDSAVSIGAAERLITRIVDGEASEAERAEFERQADREPSLWRALAEHQQSAGLLQRGFNDALAAAKRVELPLHPGDGAPQARGEHARLRGRWPWMAAGLGWAAAVVLAVLWTVTGPANDESDAGLTPVDLPPIDQLGYDRALHQYLDAPWVRGQMQPILLEVEPLPDGTKRVWIMRRIEEYVDVPADAQVPVNERNELTEEPAALRGASERPHEDADAPGS